MKVIFVHGRDQQDQTADELRQNWLIAWEKGLQKSNLSLPADETIFIPYYAKLLYDLKESAKAPKLILDPTRSAKQGINEAQLLKFYQEYYTEIAKAAATTYKEEMDIETINQTERGLLNWKPTQDLLAFLDKKNIFGDIPVLLATEDVFIYLTQNHIKEAVNTIVEDAFDEEPCVVVGHSLGSIITYLLLKNNPHLQVKKYITLGSPLGIKAIAKHLEAAFDDA